MRIRRFFVMLMPLVLCASLAMAQGIASIGTPSAHLLRQNIVIQSRNGARHLFHAELAQTGADWEKGLMFRRSLNADAGMLFLFPKAQRQTFWMKNTFIPLDMLFIRPDGTIISIHPNAVPQSLQPISSVGEASAVLEINGGETSALDIQAGDIVIDPVHFRAGK